MHADTFLSTLQYLTKYQDLAVAYFPLQRDKEGTFRNSVKNIFWRPDFP